MKRFRRKSLSHSAKNVFCGTQSCFINFGYRKMLWIRGGLGVLDFPSKLICLTVPKHFVREAFYAAFQKYSGNEKFCLRREYHDFLSPFFCLTVSKIFVGEPFCAVFQNFSGNQKVHVKQGRGVYEDFPSKFFCLTVRKNCLAESSSVSSFSGIEKC